MGPSLVVEVAGRGGDLEDAKGHCDQVDRLITIKGGPEMDLERATSSARFLTRVSVESRRLNC
jgi:hypothetical protein